MLGFPGGSAVKNLLPRRSHRRLGFNPWVGKILWRKAWQPTPGFLPGEFHRQRSLVGYNPWGHEESDTTEWLTQTPREALFCLCLIRRLVTGFRDYPNNPELSPHFRFLNLITSAKTLLLNNITFTDPRNLTWHPLGTLSRPTTVS